MGKYSHQSSYGERQSRIKTVHPIWRGVGLALILLVPFLGYVGTLVLLEENQKNHWFPLPTDLFVRGFGDPLILIKVIMTVAISFLLYIVFSFMVFGMYSMFAPPRYGPYDAPQPSSRGRNTRRSR